MNFQITAEAQRLPGSKAVTVPFDVKAAAIEQGTESPAHTVALGHRDVLVLSCHLRVHRASAVPLA
jgi:hypothetical protein